ncbi:MAG: hypothetical protein Q7S56_03675 [Nanoarchaeota archaeon]|nr:hypothetical protein [Nanoarchaeota archaeon]
MKKEIKNIFCIFGIILFLGIILNLNNVIAAEAANSQGVSYCAERTTDGAWCQNVPLNKVDTKYRSIPASCEATSYCKLGTCLDGSEGTCLGNTPQQVCQTNGGIWDERDVSKIPQCQLGCCNLGDQAAFVTQTRCKQLSTLYGLDTSFDANIKNENTCVLSASSSAKGACVFEDGLQNTCKFTTQTDCNSGDYGENVSFHADYLCSAENLGTNCAPTQKTTCVPEKDEVYFVDSCGNLGNIYDSAKVKDKAYWTKIVDKASSCGVGSGNANSASCGSCDYFLGSTCKAYQSSKDSASPKYWNNICRDLSCSYQGQTYKNGETWCALNPGTSKVTPEFKPGNPTAENLPGSRYGRLVCYDGEVTVEPCADFRQEVCVQSDIAGFSTAACVVNQWQDCFSQKDQKSCENSARRDCQWVKGVGLNQAQGSTSSAASSSGSTPAFTNGSITGGAIFGIGGSSSSASSGNTSTGTGGACVPKYAPGFNFWSSTGQATSICSLGSTQCTVTYSTDAFGKKTVVSGQECLDSSWKNKMNNLCVSLGDCGSSVNYIGVKGYYDADAFYTSSGGENATK